MTGTVEVDLGAALVAVGGLFLLGLVADAIGQRTQVPRVTLLILLGLGLGPAGLDMLPAALEAWYPFLATAALTMVAFVLGGGFGRSGLSARGREILVVSAAVTAATLVLIAGGLAAVGVALPLAILLGAIAMATDPAAVRDVVRQSGGRGPFVDRLLGIVAVDDAWGLLVFGLAMVAAGALAGSAAGNPFLAALGEIGGSLALGLSIGLPAAALTGRLRPGEPTQAEALGVVFLSAGLAVWLELSFLLVGMTAGAAVANLARHHDRPFHEIENVQWPFLVLFFILAGASARPEMLAEVGAVGIAYVLLRFGARVAGGWIGGRLAGLGNREGLWTGVALGPQAGVALGMALVAGEQFPEWRDRLLALTVATTIVFEVAGPLLTRRALLAAGAVPPETGTGPPRDKE